MLHNYVSITLYNSHFIIEIDWNVSEVWRTICSTKEPNELTYVVPIRKGGFLEQKISSFYYWKMIVPSLRRWNYIHCKNWSNRRQKGICKYYWPTFMGPSLVLEWSARTRDHCRKGTDLHVCSWGRRWQLKPCKVVNFDHFLLTVPLYSECSTIIFLKVGLKWPHSYVKASFDSSKDTLNLCTYIDRIWILYLAIKIAFMVP